MLRHILLATAVMMAAAFSPAMPQGLRFRKSRGLRSTGVYMKSIRIEKDVESVGQALCDILAGQAQKAIQERGHFSFSIPGGSVLKMLSAMETSQVDWRYGAYFWFQHWKGCA
jgi:hypothetical protein